MHRLLPSVRSIKKEIEGKQTNLAEVLQNLTRPTTMRTRPDMKNYATNKSTCLGFSRTQLGGAGERRWGRELKHGESDGTAFFGA